MPAFCPELLSRQAGCVGLLELKTRRADLVKTEVLGICEMENQKEGSQLLGEKTPKTCLGSP